jgi:hypothetical protein
VEHSGQDGDDAWTQRQQQHEADHDDQIGQRHARDLGEPVIRQALDDEQVEADRRRDLRHLDREHEEDTESDLIEGSYA